MPEETIVDISEETKEENIQEESSNEQKVEILDDPIVEENNYDISGLVPEEVEMAKELGIITEDLKKEVKEEKKEVKEVAKEDEVDKDPDSFDKIDEVFEKDEKKFHETYTPNQKALYFKSKADRRKRQEISKEYDDLKAKYDEALKGANSKDKLDKIAELLANKDIEPTIDMLQAVINEQKQIEEPRQADVDAKQQATFAKIQQKNKYAEQIGSAQHENFIEMAKLANELYQQDRENGVYRSAIDSAYGDNVDETGLVNTIIQVAKFHPKFNEISKTVDNDAKNKVDRVIKNSKKKISSATVSSSGSRIVSEADLTPELAAKLPQDKWNKLSPETKDRILSQLS